MKTYDALIIGSGAAGLNAADCLYDNGVTDIAIITEGLYSSTSINTGSDKQTYYKLSTTGDEKDSVLDMAKTYYSCGGIEGYHALTEAALSLRCFFKLVEAGVPFPMNSYGEYVGYRTDHDSHKRASSCGPLTSKYMCEALIKRVSDKNIDIFEGKRVIRLLRAGDSICGCIAIDISDASFTVYRSNNIILATGGAAGIYKSSVYPVSHMGGIGCAIRVGASCTSLAEWQYGIASTEFRWNLSGSYQQVIPKYVSMDDDGNLHEFLRNYVGNCANDLVFQKGYNWPFSPKNLDGKSSLIDIAVYTESVIKGRRVFLDFRENPTDYDYSRLSDEAREYLQSSGLEQCKSPIERLHKLNDKAYRLYLEHGIDLEKRPLAAEICAQHCNGGLTVDENYMTDIRGLYACGECAGVFGATRPGGSALNSTQVSSLKAALNIAEQADTKKITEGFDEIAAAALAELERNKHKLLDNGESPDVIREQFSSYMSKVGAFIRRENDIKSFFDSATKLYLEYFDVCQAGTSLDIYKAFIGEDLLLTLLAVLKSELVYSSGHKKSRGGYIIPRGDGDILLECSNIELECDNSAVTKVWLTDGEFEGIIHSVSPIPLSEQWFEKVAFGAK